MKSVFNLAILIFMSFQISCSNDYSEEMVDLPIASDDDGNSDNIPDDQEDDEGTISEEDLNILNLTIILQLFEIFLLSFLNTP